MKRKNTQSEPLKAKTVVGLFKLFAFMPFRLNRMIGGFIGWVNWLTKSRNVRITEINIRLCFPELNDEQVKQRVRASCIQSGMLLTEAAWVWLRPQSRVSPLINKVVGKEVLDAALAKGKGVLMASAHLGNWEPVLLWEGFQRML